ncbi:MAG: hypothetical protein Q9167_006614 [Letrouitia subvulpina]
MDFVLGYLTTDFNPLRTVAGLATLALILYLLGLFIYRLNFHPLAKFPGPKAAAATFWYEFYYHWWLQGQYIFEIEKMHNKYGPIVRVNPDELSIHDPAVYNEIYVIESKRRTENYNLLFQGTDFEGISRLEPVIVQFVKKLVARLELLKGTDTVVHLNHAFNALTRDVINKTCCDDEEVLLDDPKFGSWWSDFIRNFTTALPLISAFPIIIRIASMVPESIVLWVYPQLQSFTGLRQIAMKRIADAKQEKLDNDRKGTQTGDSTSLFRYIINSDMPESERSNERLAKEAQILLTAGSQSTSLALSHASYFILANRSLRSRLEKELEVPMSRYPEVVPTWAELEKVPILQAIIKETLRLVFLSRY